MRKGLLILCLGFFLVVWGDNPYIVQNDTLVLPRSIEFHIHGNDVKDTADAMLDYVAQYLKENPSVTKLRVESHVFTEKNAAENLALSLQRAALVSYYLTQKGVDCKRLLPVAFGDTKPIDSTNVFENTRLEFHNAEVNGLPVEGLPVDGAALKKFDPCE